MVPSPGIVYGYTTPDGERHEVPFMGTPWPESLGFVREDEWLQSHNHNEPQRATDKHPEPVLEKAPDLRRKLSDSLGK